MRTPYQITLIYLMLVSNTVFAGFIGGGQSHITSKSFDNQSNGARLDFGSHINSALDLEFSLVDFGESSYQDPTIIDPEPLATNDLGSFEDTGFGKVSGSEGGLVYRGIEKFSTQGISSGFKLRKKVNNWFQVYARASFLAWKADTTEFELYTTRTPLNENGDLTQEELAVNLTPCGGLTVCRNPIKSNSHLAMDFWYGYGFIIKPFSWLAVRTEYSITTLNAVDFPKSVLEGLSTTLEIHY